MMITNPRGTRAAWDDGLFDALILAAHALGGEDGFGTADRTLVAVGALKFWPDNSIVGMVGRIIAVEDSITRGCHGIAKAMLAERNTDSLLIDALFRPVLFASTLRDMTELEVDRLAEAIDATGLPASTFGLRE